MYVMILYADLLGAEIICRLLESAGHHPVVVGTEVDAALALACARFDAIIVDLDHAPMPVCEQLRLAAGAPGANLAIIGVSRDTRSLARYAEANSCFDCILLKPLDPFTLGSAIGSHVSVHPQPHLN
jgi:DNA-binding response OmpR family regulator